MKQYRLTKTYITPDGCVCDAQDLKHSILDVYEASDQDGYVVKIFPEAMIKAGFDGIEEVTQEEEPKKKTYERWKPREGGIFFVNILFHGTHELPYVENGNAEHVASLGMAYPTEGDAQYELDRTKALVELWDIANELNQGWEPDWNNGSEIKCLPGWDYRDSSVYGLYTGSVDTHPDLPAFKWFPVLADAFDRLGIEKTKLIFRVGKRHPWLPVKEGK